MNNYNEIIKTLRTCLDMQCRNCKYAETPSCRAVLNTEAANAIEELQRQRDASFNRLCDWCGVCPKEKRDVWDCEIAMIGDEYTSTDWATCQPTKDGHDA